MAKLYIDPIDQRYWEWTYPYSYMQGYGPPLLRYLPDDEAIAKYKIAPKYIPQLKPRPEETIIDSYELMVGLSLMEGAKITFRVWWLRLYYFKEIFKVSDEIILYQDPQDLRYWELTYPRGYKYGSGYPMFEVPFKRRSGGQIQHQILNFYYIILS